MKTQTKHNENIEPGHEETKPEHKEAKNGIAALLVVDDDSLLQPCDPVTEFDSELSKQCSSLGCVLKEYNGIGLGAPQIGIFKQFFIMNMVDVYGRDGRLQVFVNPEILEASEETEEMDEGCLSYPGRAFKIKRHLWVKVKFQNVFGKVKTLRLSGLQAQAFQHELDHMSGKVLPNTGDEIDLKEKEAKD